MTPEPGQLWSRRRANGTEHSQWIALSSPTLNDHGFEQVLMLWLHGGSSQRQGSSRWFNARGFLNARSWRRKA